MVVSFLMLFYQ